MQIGAAMAMHVKNEGSGKRRGSVTVYGEPLNRTSDSLAAAYKEMNLEDFLASEARFGIGSYVLVAEKGKVTRIITSPGYCGGYVRKVGDGVHVATTLRDVVHADLDGLTMNGPALSYLFTKLPHSTSNMFPLTTPFEGIHRLPPATYMELENGAVKKFCSYLHFPTKNPPNSLLDALTETCTVYADHYRKTGQTPSVLFSGGADSLVILLMMQKILGKDDVQALTVETAHFHSQANGHHRALPVAEHLGFEVRMLKSDSLSSDKVVDDIARKMRYDFVNSRAPDLAFADFPDINGMVMHGQNMDSMSGNNMVQLQANLERGFLSNEQMAKVDGDEALARQTKAFLGNMMFTSSYLSDPLFQRSTVEYYRKAIGKVICDPHPGTIDGIVRGMIATQYPNMLNRPERPFSRYSQLEVMSSEAGKMLQYLNKESSPEKLVDLLRFYGYGHLVMKRGCTVPSGHGAEVSYVPMSGPIISYFCGRGRGLSEASSPKRDIYNLIRNLSGKAYSDVIKAKGAASKGKLKEIDDGLNRGADDKLLKKYGANLRKDGEIILSRLHDKGAKKALSDLFAGFCEGNSPDSSSYSLYNQSQSRVILNISRVLAV